MSIESRFSLLSSRPPRQRGIEFEALLADLFRREHFDVQSGPITFNGRQVDVVASRDDMHLLIEAKWRTKKSDVGDIDNQRLRLAKASPGVIGVLVDMSGFAKPGVARASEYSERPLLLVDGDEVRRVVSGSTTMYQLIVEKRQAMVTRGETWFLPAESVGDHLVVEGTSISFKTADLTHAIWESEAEYDEPTFVLDISDIDWGVGLGLGVSLDVLPPVDDSTSLVRCFSNLVRQGWVGEQGSWQITCGGRRIAGFSADGFLGLLSNLPAHPGFNTGRDIQVVYTEMCDGGFLTLSADIRLPMEYATQTAISFQLTGVPLDVGPFKTIAASLGVAEGLYFRPHNELSVETKRIAPSAPRPPKGLVVLSELETEWVVGVVLENVLSEPDRTRLGISESAGDLVCALRDWHPVDQEHQYWVSRVESAWSSYNQVTKVSADW